MTCTYRKCDLPMSVSRQSASREEKIHFTDASTRKCRRGRGVAIDLATFERDR